MERSTPERRAGTVGPRASEGSAASRSPNVVPAGKWTSPPKAKVTACPSPLQSGSSRFDVGPGRLLGDGVEPWGDDGGDVANAGAPWPPPPLRYRPRRARASRKARDQTIRLRLT